MRRYYLQSGLWMSVLTVLILGSLTLLPTTATAKSYAHATLSLDLIPDGEWSNQIDDGVTSGTVSGQGTTIAVEVFAKGVTTPLQGVVIKFDFDASVLTFVKAENSAFALSIPESDKTGTNLAATAPVTLWFSGFLARAEFTTAVDVTGREFSIGIKQVTLVENALSSDVITTTNAISFNANDANPSLDFDGDGSVGMSDFLSFTNHFGTSRGNAGYDAKYDLDGDDAIGMSDFLIFTVHFGSQVPPSGDGGSTGTDFDLDSDNNYPVGGITYANNRFYVVDRSDDKVYVYTSRGQRDRGTDFDLDSDNDYPENITYANNRFYVVDSSDDKVYVYTSRGQRDTGADFDLDSDNRWPEGITYVNNRFYVVDDSDDKVYVYTSRGQRDTGADFNLDSDNNSSAGITYVNNRFYVVDDSDDKVYVYTSRGQSGSTGGGGGGSPDLTVDSPSVSDSTLTTGQSFTLSATVRNQGTGTSASTTLRYYRSSNSTISTSDTEVGTDSVSGLSVSGTSGESVSLNAPSSAGTYYYGACVNSVTGESNTGNNCSDGVSVTVSALASSELLIAPGETKGYSKTFSANFSFGDDLDLSYRVRSSTVDDGLSGLSDVKVRSEGSRSNFSLRTSVESITFSYDIHVRSTVPLNTTLRATIVYEVGTTSLLGFFSVRETYTVSLVILVRDSGSNGGSSGGGGSNSPDLIVESPSVSDNTLTSGQSFTLSATVRNQGTGTSASTTLRYYQSSNSTISTSDTEVGTDSVGGLSASGTSAESISLNAPSSAGTYYYGACVDGVSGESDTGNNCSDAVAVTVSSSSSGGGGGSGVSHGACRAGLVVNPNESCTYKGFTFSVSSSGRGSIAFFSAGTGIDTRGSTVNGVRWDFHATKNSGSNSWTIHTAD